MTEQDSGANMPQPVAAIANHGYAIWASEDEETWEINLVAKDGSHFEFESRLLKVAR